MTMYNPVEMDAQKEPLLTQLLQEGYVAMPRPRSSQIHEQGLPDSNHSTVSLLLERCQK